ncbi:disulfide bond formation protein DsbB [Blochmannia endosymbiont of Camponotus (Colobopsis) obliquus]|uniref:disulfide bond formation protein DsbB n=1 Tax=Blochmannia endosymbiont of Camponotus (Colobopsis) obliquus TaxID=1505597 RepID=UPI00061A7205|nr:disulfide bond formation protein DsbB [Blochmannia endosymbiont of Camponotus (Colobopsis) obliquus]AKC60593.1 Disulfide bond formation protein B [Blochmannia endosymbiont of Camponotus (Colobopsis) obliquus]
MLNSLNAYFKTRHAWLLLIISASTLEIIALILQHCMLFDPCVLCIYQRCTLYGIIAAGLIGAIAPNTPLRFIGIFIWLYNASQGLLLAKKHIDIQSNTSPFVTCDFFVDFPSWLPLDKWLPAIFSASGDCTEHKWFFLSLEMSQWMLIIFGIYLIACIFVLIAQFFKTKS